MGRGRGRGPVRALALDLPGRFVCAKALKTRVPELPVGGPFTEHDLGHEFRPYPVDASFHHPAPGKGRGACFEGVQLLAQGQQCSSGKTSTHLARVNEFTVVVITDEQSP